MTTTTCEYGQCTEEASVEVASDRGGKIWVCVECAREAYGVDASEDVATTTYHCNECGREAEGGTDADTDHLHCPDHPSAVIDSVRADPVASDASKSHHPHPKHHHSTRTDQRSDTRRHQ